MPAQEIEADGFKINHRIYMALDGYNHVAMLKSLGIFLSSLADILASDRPDWILLAGDRGEQLMGAVAGAFCYIPVAHIQAGELSGNIDGMTRHAIGKYAHLHLAANDDAAQRLVKLGEEPFRVHNVGAPQLDELVEGEYTDQATLQERMPFDLSKDFILVVQHPVTEEYEMAAQQIQVTMDVLNRFDLPKAVILPNSDAGSLMIREGIETNRKGDYHCYANLPRRDFLGLMRLAACMVGNSSSGLLEAPTFALPAVNLGRRQAGRLQGENVINADFVEGEFMSALERALSPQFRAGLRASCRNPYGDGHSAQRVLELITQIQVTDQWLVKKLTY